MSNSWLIYGKINFAEMNSNVLLNPQSRILQRKFVFLAIEVILVYDNFYNGHESTMITNVRGHVTAG